MPMTLSRSMESALFCCAGVAIPSWSVHTWTVATVRALARRGYMDKGRVTPKGRRLVRRMLARRPPLE